MPKITNITAEQYQTVADQAGQAEELLNDPRWQFVRDYFQASADYAKKMVWEDTVTDSEEHVTISETIKRVFKRSKKSQVSELVGQYKLVTKFFEDMQFYVQLKVDLDRQIELGTVRVDGKAGGKDISGPKTSE